MHLLLVYDPFMLGCWRIFQTVSTVTIRVTETTTKAQLSCYLVKMLILWAYAQYGQRKSEYEACFHDFMLLIYS